MRLKYAAIVLALSVGLAAPLRAEVKLGISPDFQTAMTPGSSSSMKFILFVSGEPQADVVFTVAYPASFAVTGAAGDGWDCKINDTTVTCTRHVAPAGIPLIPFVPPVTVDYTVPSSLDGGRFKVVATLAPNLETSGKAVSATRTVDVYRTFYVSRADDFGAGSFRDVIATANERCDNSVLCHVLFTEPMAIHPQAPLPAITACALFIDAGLATDIAGPRAVEIEGSRTTYGNGLELRSGCRDSGVTMHGLSIGGFPGNGIVIAAPQPSLFNLIACSIGTNSDATAARPNGLRGISVETPFSTAAISACVISGNTRSGIAAWDAATLYVNGCLIGVGKDLRGIPNGASGIFINGGNAAIGGGLIALNHEFGVAIGAGAHHVHVDSSIIENGGQGIDYGLDGPTPVDPAGGIPPAPVLVDGFYDAAKNATTIQVHVPTTGRKPTEVYSVFFYSNIPNPISLSTAIYPAAYLAPNVETFTATLPGDHRRETIRALTQHQLFSDSEILDSSEFSNPIVIP
jgi:hypothetical protein